MNHIGYKDATTHNVSLADPFNYPSLDRNMLMSMNTITTRNDHVQTNTSRFSTQRR